MYEILSLVVPALFILAMLASVLTDLFTMTIPNRLTLAIAVSFFAAAFLYGMPLQVLIWHVGVALAVLGICYILFELRAMGGGDVKLMAATALWFGPAMTLPYVFLASVIGGLLTIVIVILRRFPLPEGFAKHRWIARLHDRNRGVPYGLALGPAAIVIFPATVWMNGIAGAAVSG